MDITSTSASSIQVNKPSTPNAAPAAIAIPEDTNLKAIQDEIKQITDEMKQALDSKLQPLAQDTVQLSKTPAPAETAAAPVTEAPPEQPKA